MRKRLIESITKSKRSSRGYTLTELLTVVAIIAVACAIAIPSIFAIRNALRFAQANNYAKSIFLAAQQNLTEMRSDGGLGPVQIPDGDEYQVYKTIPSSTFPDEFRSEYVWTSNGGPVFDSVLPSGSIDAEVRNDQIVIEYNPVTGNVYSVFYYDKTDLNLQSEYQGGNLPREKAARKDMMVGYYDGSGLNSSQIELEQTQATVIFKNEEEGIVQVLIPMPESYFGDYDDFASALNVSLTIVGEQTLADLATQVPEEGGAAAQPQTPPDPLTMQIKTAGNMDGCALDVDGRTVIIEYPIDSLANRRSFANYASGKTSQSLTTLLNEDEFTYGVLPGENITITADVTFSGDATDMVKVSPGILSGVNPMFEYLQPSGNGDRYVLAVSNGRNLQNLNAIAPSIAQRIDSVVFTSDIYWNDTVTYYNKNYAGGSTYYNTTKVGEESVYDEAPARALPYFVPIHNGDLFGTAQFIFPKSGDGISGLINNLINSAFGSIFNLNNNVPTLTDEIDVQFTEVTDAAGNKSYEAESIQHATIEGNGHKVYHINVDSTLYAVPNVSHTDKTLRGRFYATGANQVIDYDFSGLFGYINTPINNLHVVNPIVKGADLVTEQKLTPIYSNYRYYNIFTGKWEYIPIGYSYEEQINNPATGALIGASGYNTLITNCSTYIDKDARGYRSLRTGPVAYSESDAQNWYGVSGTGAVGGLVGYAKSHRTTTGIPDNDLSVLAFSRCFAAVNVSGEMRGYSYSGKDYGYSNGVGGLIGNSQMTNFYECYASGNVLGENCHSMRTSLSDPNWHSATFGESRLSLLYTGRQSWGTGGFVGSSHGTKYTACFATGNVSADGSGSNQYGFSATAKGSGGFVGIMVLDGDHTYGNAGANAYVAQTTIFTDCYAVGEAKLNNSADENFSGANGRTLFQNGIRIFDLNNVFDSSGDKTNTYIIGDYYRLYAPHVVAQNSVPDYKDIYVFRNSYYLTNYHINNDNPQANSNGCADPEPYDTFTNLTGYHTADSNWVANQITQIKNIELSTPIFGWQTGTYGSRYFTSSNGMETTYKNLFAEAYSTDSWNAADYSTTHGYDLNGVYPFNKIKGLDYYGDWPSKPSDVGMAYFESYYNDSNFYYHFDKESTATLKTDDKVIVDKDGYAILSASKATMTVSIGGKTAVTMTAPTQTFSTTSKEYHIYRLSDAQLAEAAKCLEGTNEFYVKVTVKQDGKTYTMYFNPNVAKSQINPVEGNTDAMQPDAAPTTMYVRSARQFKAMADLDNFWGEKYSYIQQLNIDATAYLWADKIDDINQYTKVSSIGSVAASTTDKANPFNASYTALYIDEKTQEEKQYKLSGFQPVQAGLFGFIGQTGVVSDLIVECGDIAAGNEKTEDVAVLAGVTYGTIDNVDLALNGNVSLTAKNCAALLAAHSTGTIVDCDVTVAKDKTVTITAPNAGGLIGTAQGTADNKSYLSNSNITISSAFTVNNATNAGGIVGLATHLTADKMNVTLATMTVNTSADASYAGGLAGYAKDSAFTGVASAVVNNKTVNPVEITINGAMKADKSFAAGAIGGAENTTVTGVDVSTKGISGDTAAGFLGTGVNADASNSIVTVSGPVTGVKGAAGVAGTIGSQSVFDHVPVTLNGVTVSSTEGNAAGYALEIKGEAFVNNGCSVTLGEYTTASTDGKVTARTVKSKSTIHAGKDAAGFACVIDGTVGDASVIGPAAIEGENAAGFAVTLNGSAARTHVSPALTADANGYLYNANANLTVTGNTAAAGYALTVGEKATVENSYTLCSVSAAGTVKVETEENNSEASDPTVPSDPTVASDPTEATDPVDAQSVQINAAYGFAGTNSGTINRCTANVDLAGGFSFVGTNNGLVTTSYGWFDNQADDEVVTKIEGDCNISYFADMNSEAVEVYNADGVYESTTLGNLNNLELKGFTTSYKSYPYSAKIKPANYPYLMLRDHYGNWYTPPQYAYGVAYYEFYDDGTMAAHLWDLSDVEVTVEDKLLPEYVHASGLNDEKGISQYGYAVFCKEGSGMLSELSGAEITGLDYNSGKATYKFYKFVGSGDVPVAVPDTAFSSTTATVDTRFANAVNVTNNTYEVRTAYHLSNVEQLSSAAFNQTHNISADTFNAIDNFQGTYNGGGHKITVATGNTWMNTVNGTVENLTIDVTTALNAPVFGTVSKSAGTAETPVYALSSITVNAGSNVTSVPGALLANKVSNGSAVNGCQVTAGNVSTSAPSFGGLIVTNEGKLNANTVTITQLTANGSGIVGGLAATNSGTIGGKNTVTVNIVYAPGTTTAASIGGLVGENSGSINGATVKAGQITLSGTPNSGFIVGGAIGKDNITTVEHTDSVEYQNVTTSMALAPEWAVANTNTAACPAGKGSVGMFVGSVHSGTFKDCSSAETSNAKYQFLGVAYMSTMDIPENYWVSDKGISTLSAYADTDTVTGPITAASDSNSAELNSASETCNYVPVGLSNCTFYMGDQNSAKTQILGQNQYFYSMKTDGQSEFSVNTPLAISFNEGQTKTYDVNIRTAVITEKQYTGYYHKVSDDYYAKAYVTSKRDEGNVFLGTKYTYTYTLSYLDVDGESQIICTSDPITVEESLFGGTKTGQAKFENLYQVSLPAVDGKKYMVVTDSTAVIENSGLSISNINKFREEDILFGYLYDYADSKLTRSNVAYSVTVFDEFFTSATAIPTYTVGSLKYGEVTKFQLYPVTETPNAYYLLTFTHQDSADYQRQLVTYK